MAEWLKGCGRIAPIFPISTPFAKAAGLYKRDYGRSHGVGLADAILE